ncbi:hypothetical protein [Streptomyces sp. NPDC058424]|uniref:hypothetical protein n=1 Tax=Streptomyces sp. NPDC058424 TaxID=3346491 RepID=UPI00365B6ECB
MRVPLQQRRGLLPVGRSTPVWSVSGPGLLLITDKGYGCVTIVPASATSRARSRAISTAFWGSQPGEAGRDDFRQALSCVSHASSGSADHGTRW